MMRTIFKSKIHRATVTHADLHYVGSVTAAAHLVNVGDLVILMTYAQMTRAEAVEYVPTVVHVDSDNAIVHLGTDPAEAITEGLLRPAFAL